MPSNDEQDFDVSLDEDDLDVRQQLETIDGSLMAGMPLDDRFESGVPAGQRANSLDFIQMTGLTRAPLRPTNAAPQVPEAVVGPDDLNPTAPLSFYEAGVSDVDDGDPRGTDGVSDVILDSSLIAERASDTLRAAPSSSAAAFKDIVAGLEGGRPLAEERGEEKAPPTPEPSKNLHDDEDYGSRSASADLLALLDSMGNDSEPDDEPEATEEQARDDDDDSATDDWDAYLDEVAPKLASKLPEAPSETTILRPKANALEEAEQLMQALGQGKKSPPTEMPPPAVDVPDTSSLLPIYTTPTAAPIELDSELAYDYSAMPTRRRSRRHTRNGRRGKGIIKLLLLLGILVSGVVAGYVYVLEPAMEQAEDLAVKAERLLSEAKYREASVAFDRLSADPQRGADAAFQAAYALTLGPERSVDEKNTRYREALTRFDAFVKGNPQHPKRTRALALMGRLYYELAKYDEAIEILRDETNQKKDPAAALAMYRYLARAYSMQGEYEAAEAAYMQAATSPGNYSVDQDYVELAEMFKTRADLPGTEAEKAEFATKAMENWQRAVNVPGIEPRRKEALKERLIWLNHQEHPEMLEGMPIEPSESPLVERAVMDDIALPAPVEAPVEESIPVEGTHEPAPDAEFSSSLPAPAPEIVIPEEISPAGPAPAATE